MRARAFGIVLVAAAFAVAVDATIPHVVQEIVDRLDLQPHPEGAGYFKETYRCELVVKSAQDKDRNCATAIYFLMSGQDFSAFHKLKSDELYHHYLGGPMEIVEILPNGSLSLTTLGKFTKHQKLQHVVSAGHWFALRLPEVHPGGSPFSLVGLTVSPGFDINDFELGTYASLAKMYPQHEVLIKSLTRASDGEVDNEEL
eukprot:GHVU01080572.1.p1 GENE.GHVU01080572.1~~GHVU01080572.1.p1  ORF type:complete len:200 (-),score=5.90 GHVU01080572.1:17-616(-)